MTVNLNPWLVKVLKEHKTIFLLGDFNADLLKYDNHGLSNEFLDSLSCPMFLSHITQPIE